MTQGYHIEQLKDDPILIVSYKLPIPSAVLDMFNEITACTAEILDAHEGKMYRINDFSDFGERRFFSQAIQGLAEETKGIPGTSSDPRVIPVFVGISPDVELIVKAVKQEQYGGWDQLPLFATLDEAVAAIRELIAKNRQEDGRASRSAA